MANIRVADVRTDRAVTEGAGTVLHGDFLDSSGHLRLIRVVLIAEGTVHLLGDNPFFDTLKATYPNANIIFTVEHADGNPIDFDNLRVVDRRLRELNERTA